MKRGACQLIHDHTLAEAASMRGAVRPENVRAFFLELDPEPPLPFGWEKCYDLQTGMTYFKDSRTGNTSSEDPRGHNQQQQGVDSEPRQRIARSLSATASDHHGDRRLEWIHMAERSPLEGVTKITMEDKLSSWKHVNSSKKLPPLLSLKSTDSLPSLELSLRLESPHAQESSLFHSPISSETRETVSEKAGQVKLEQLEQCHQNFLGPNHNMGPFPSISENVKEEPATITYCWDQLPGVRAMEPLTFMNSACDTRERPDNSAPLNLEQFKVRDFLGLNHNMGPFSSNAGKVTEETMPAPLDQSSGACTLERIQVALERSQFHYRGAPSSVPAKIATQNDNSVALPSWCTKSNPSPLPVPSPLMKLPQQALSPTSSDASSAASSRSSRHSSTSPSVMSFQGVELDDVGGHGSSSEASPSSLAFQTSNLKEARGQSASVMVAVGGCTTCHMFVMLSKDNPCCPKCGSTGLLEILPTSPDSPRKRQKMESSKVGTESRRRWDAQLCQLS